MLHPESVFSVITTVLYAYIYAYKPETNKPNLEHPMFKNIANNMIYSYNTHTHTHTHTYVYVCIYIYIYITYDTVDSGSKVLDNYQCLDYAIIRSTASSVDRISKKISLSAADSTPLVS